MYRRIHIRYAAPVPRHPTSNRQTGPTATTAQCANSNQSGRKVMITLRQPKTTSFFALHGAEMASTICHSVSRWLLCPAYLKHFAARPALPVAIETSATTHRHRPPHEIAPNGRAEPKPPVWPGGPCREVSVAPLPSGHPGLGRSGGGRLPSSSRPEPFG